MFFGFFFFKQKTAYEMRISDWSSDVCSSDLPMFEKIIADLSMPTEGLEYEIRSFTKKGDGSSLEPTDYLIHSERHGIPQSRHRVILLGVRKGLDMPQHQLQIGRASGRERVCQYE